MRCPTANGLEQFGLRFLVGLTLAMVTHPACAQSIAPYHRSLTVSATDPVLLDVGVPRGELRIFYSREGEVSVTAAALAPPGVAPTESLPAPLTVEQAGNHIRIRYTPDSAHGAIGAFLYRIDVPYRTVVTASIHEGKLSVSGVLGPVQVTSGRGNIDVSYVSKEVTAHAGAGNITLQVIGGKVEARAAKGNISCTRVSQDIVAETQDGDIDFAVVGASSATVKTGAGRITIRGARGKLTASTDAGELHVKAVPHDDWQVRSKSGTVRIELPPDVKAELDAASPSGAISFQREDVPRPENDHTLRQSLNGGGPHVEARSESGQIVIE